MKHIIKKLLIVGFGFSIMLSAEAINKDEYDYFTLKKEHCETNNTKKRNIGLKQNVRSEVFNEEMQKAMEIEKAFCKSSKISDMEIFRTSTINLLDGLLKIGITSDDIDRLKDYQNSISPRIGKFEVSEEKPNLYLNISQNDEKNRITLNKEDQIKCIEKVKSIDQGARSCKKVVKEFRTIFNYAQGHKSKIQQLYSKYKLLAKYEQWDDYLSNSKSQYIWELLANNYTNKLDKDSKFPSPPQWQLVLLHPTIVIENVSDAIDGQETKEALMIEAIGVDYWSQDKWYFPSGASLVALYSDRAGVDDWRYGVSFTFNHQVSIGVTKGFDDDSTGVFVTVDLWKLFEDKKSVLEKYTGRVNLR